MNHINKVRTLVEQLNEHFRFDEFLEEFYDGPNILVVDGSKSGDIPLIYLTMGENSVSFGMRTKNYEDMYFYTGIKVEQNMEIPIGEITVQGNSLEFTRENINYKIY